MRIFLLFFAVAFFSTKAQTYNYYFGNIHSHTGFSDGSQDSLVSGISTPAGAYTFAKASQNFDFLGISEHNHYSNNNNPGFQIQSWPLGISQANAANDDGNFVCLFGMEWGVSSNYHGHVLIYNFPQLIGWEANNYDVYNSKDDYDGLFRKIKNQPGAFCTLAHPGGSDFTTDGTSSTSLLYGAYNATYDSAIVAVPLRNGLYNTATTDYTAYPASNFLWYYKGILSKGYHLGINYDHDNHNTTFGRNNAGRMVVLMPSLTKANFFEAIHAMRFYASDDWNAQVEFKMNNNWMGSILSGTINPSFTVIHNDGDSELADSIKIWRGISNNAAPAQVVSITKANNTSNYTDNTMLNGYEYFYFAEIKQTDGQWIITSPIWYTNTLPAGIKENDLQIHFNFFPNPASKMLSISVSDCKNYKISVLDLLGKELISEFFNDKDYQLNIESLAAGTYLLKIESENRQLTKKLMVE
ncbi:MAG: T9SS type A sorting domain-containing protein [Sphingobacteriaceae bacterium]|nr:T9SS type A sorting domain-containing protein [Sphingobacteriaceae bacterium]